MPRKTRESASGSLLADGYHRRAVILEVSGHREQQRTGAGNHDALVADRQTGFGQCLKATGTENVRQSPSGKRQEEFASTCRQNQITVRDVEDGVGGFGIHHSVIGAKNACAV